ncbi:YdcF family protein [Streptomyces sp. NPDC048623]|uniref:YdcF family protein n=1 Tax=Streptomyces sp. NPDC048623 TaxID=3155761 RepID=UPI003439C469
MGHERRPCSAAIGLGSHDLGVAATAAHLYHAGFFPTLVFSGGNSPITRARFPRGEAVHFREHALSLGVPDEAILVEPKAANTGQNVTIAVEQDVPEDVYGAYQRLVNSGFDSRLISS